MAVVLSRKWNRKPPGWYHRVDLSHPLARDIRAFIDCRDLKAFDLVRAVRGTVGGTIVTDKDPKWQNDACALDATDDLSIATHWTNDITGAITIIWRGVVTNFAANRHIISKTDGTFAISYLAYFDAFDGIFMRGSSAASTNYTWTGGQPAAGAWATVAITHNGVAATAAKMWLNRVAQGDSAVAGTTAAASTTGDVHLGKDDLASFGQLVGSVSHAMVFARVLTEAEILTLEENPWQILESPTNRLYLNTVAAPAANDPVAGYTRLGAVNSYGAGRVA